ncbi:MAG: ABC transporter ATP-binding protein [Actinobacteria bacterium]|nr:ABC transporter ATP-binding protein [Actinomycetota bacterium]
MSEALLEIEGLDAYYGQAQVLERVDVGMGIEAIAVIGRNGMGKTTLCNAIMGLVPRVEGSIRFEGKEILGQPSYRIAAAGIGYVPQGRRLFRSLSVDEHLRMIGRTAGRRWTPAAVYELFPRLADRKRIGATQLSGGEQQMLAIGRALLTNPTLLIMDEPSEGLAPTIVQGMVATCKALVEEGMAVLLVEQNLGVATAVAERQLVMVSGRIATETTAQELSSDPEAQRRYLGVEPLAEHA